MLKCAGGKSAALYIQANMHKVLEEELKHLGDAAHAGAPDVIGEMFKRVYKKTGTARLALVRGGN